jgi:hypothetical protein
LSFRGSVEWLVGLSVGGLVVLSVVWIEWVFVRSGSQSAVSSVSDIKSQGQPACREDQKKCKEESINVMHECDVERMYAVYHVL